MIHLLDWSSVLTGEPRAWLLTGLLVTLLVTVGGLAMAWLVAVVLFGSRIAALSPVRWAAALVIGSVRNTPLLVQLLAWYFAGYGLLPQGLRDWLIDDHSWAMLPGGVSLLSPEFVTSALGLGLFFGAFMAEELRSGLAAVPPGQIEAARSQGFTEPALLLHILLPQAVANAWQPLVGQALNLMKFSSLASAIGLAELTYQVRQVESLKARGFEAMAAGTILYLIVGLALGALLTAAAPGQAQRRKAMRHGA